MANEEHVKIVKQGAEAIQEWRGANPDLRLDLSDANLRNADLIGANLSCANLRDSKLWEADLFGAKFSSAEQKTGTGSSY